MIAIKLEMLRGPDFHGPDYDYFEARHRFMNMGEDVYRKLHDICLVNLEEIDRAVDHFTVREIRRKDIGTVTTLLMRILRHNHMLDEVRLVRVDGSTPADAEAAPG
ncbi:MAG TPA: hypothetical protein VFR37_12580 [Longimicrobium sp.]|nr:hypothetical protein [Longimicrobium sp.]